MKRVVAFFDMFDEIPGNAKYLFSRRVEVPIPESEGQKNIQVISNNPEASAIEPAVIHIHYYEVEEMDFEELMSTDFPRKTNTDKMKEFFHKYKIPMK